VTAQKPRKCALSPPQPKTKQCSHLRPLIRWHPSSKKKPAGGGGLFLKKGEMELKAPTRSEAMTR
jgi:hypothetical protein